MHYFVGATTVLVVIAFVESKIIDLYEICDQHYAKRIFLEYGEHGTLVANTENYESEDLSLNDNFGIHKKCSVEFITCPSCIVQIKFKYLNISRTCGRATVYDSCGCDYVWIYEPPFEEVSGEQFCGRFIENSANSLNYISQTKNVAVTFIYSTEYGHAFTLDYISERNRIVYNGHPKLPNMNNASQSLNSPFFPYYYPSDLSVEYVVNCNTSELCRISLVFNDFQLASASIIEFFDWNGQRMFVTDGDIFRPPVIISSGPTLTIRFYANGVLGYGFKATYSFLLGNLSDMTFKPDIGCGGNVNNLGGGITMMNMLKEGTKYFDCVWIIAPPSNSLHLKTHLYVKVVTFSDFAGTTELTIRQGLTSNEPVVESIKQSLSFLANAKEKEHVVPIKQGFYISLKGLFRPESRLAMVYAAFNYKDCYAGSDFLCHNFRCISALLNCDGFDHCGDNSDESIACSENPKDRRYRSKTPNFLFPKIDHYSDISTATIIFLICGFGLIGIILALALLLYRVNMRARHQRQMQTHIENIHAILEESIVEVEEEVIHDDPPDYEAPPDYADVVKKRTIKEKLKRHTLDFSTSPLQESHNRQNNGTVELSGGSSQVSNVPTSPPPPYICRNFCEILRKGMVYTDIQRELCPKDIGEPSSSMGEDGRMYSTYLDHIRSVFGLNGHSIRRSLRYYKSRKALERTKHLMRADFSLIKCSSDTELQYLNLEGYDTFWPKIDSSNLGKSYSIDDVNNMFS